MRLKGCGLLPRSALALSVCLPPALSWNCSGGADAFEPITACVDSQSVSVHVSPGTSPRFTWSPACGMSSLQVVAESTGIGSWIVYSGSQAATNPLPSGVRFGQLPPAGIAPGGVQPLLPGVHYLVTVYRWVGPPGGPGSIFARGSATFVP